MEYITKEELIISEVYTHQNGNICRCDRNSNTSIYGKYINITHNVFRKPPENPGNFAINEMRLATPEEKHWLETCITADKFITFEEAMKTFVPEYVECILPELWKRTIKENNGNLIFKSDFKSTCALQIKDKLLNKTQSSFKPSTKEAYDAQFIVKEPEFVLPEKWYIKANTKEEADIMYPYFNRISKRYSNWLPSNEIMRDKYYARFNQLQYEIAVSKDELNPLIPIITFKQFKKYVLKKEIIEEKIIKPLPQFKVIETIETITKVENNEGNQFFIGDVVKGLHDLKYSITSFKYNENKTEILAICNNNDNLFVNINEIEHYIEPKIEVKNKFVLPEKWCIKNTSMLIGNYFNNILQTTCYTANFNNNNYLHSHNLGKESLKPSSSKSFSDNYIRNSFTEITLNQFEKYILKQ